MTKPHPARKAFIQKRVPVAYWQEARADLDKLIDGELATLKEAVLFYAQRYHDEHHQVSSFNDCPSSYCLEARRLVATS